MSPVDELDPDVTGRVPDDDESCPGCGGTEGVRWITGTPPMVVAGRCVECGREWAGTYVGVEPPDHSVEPLGAVLLEVIVLAEVQAGLSNEEVRERLATLAGRAAGGAR